MLDFSKTVEEHQKTLGTILLCLAKHLFYIILDNCALLLKHVEFFMHILGALGVYI